MALERINKEMEKADINTAKRIATLLAICSFIIVVLWLSGESWLNINSDRRIKDWPFTLFFSMFLISTPVSFFLGCINRAKKSLQRVSLAIIWGLMFLLIGHCGFGAKNFIYGSRAYSDRKVYIKSEFAWNPDYSYIAYEHDGFFFIKNGQPFPGFRDFYYKTHTQQLCS